VLVQSINQSIKTHLSSAICAICRKRIRGSTYMKYCPEKLLHYHLQNTTQTITATYGKPTTDPWSITCHMGSHSVACHPTQMNTPHIDSSQTGRYSIYLFRMDGRSTPPWSATLSWWWGFAPMNRKISKIWRRGAD